MDKFNSMFDSKFECVYTNQYLLGFMILCTIIYCMIIRTKVPTFIDKILRNKLFMFVAISFILERINHDTKTSVLLTLGFLLIMSIGKNKNEYFTSHVSNLDDTKVTKVTNDYMDTAAECYKSDNNHNTEYCNLSKDNMKTAQCNYCPDKKDDKDSK